ncbi:Mg2+ transporter protein, CorA-like protein [Deinococcus phoenicis]|uniref:Mg2+ transporter protein, CorA-like protein n=1 Tax=Deinococcus phoenicis TaxID=1476583 RepID=A0A016QNN1_9DEIO|nr:CorA family divalent cation transporter [Deinococcus phoenicis]EYB67566.1 Mg2+ transporter protein, CorA-like protein [Deinococcus phoenicis]
MSANSTRRAARGPEDPQASGGPHLSGPASQALTPAPPRPEDAAPGLRTYLFDAEGEDREVQLSEALVRGLCASQLLWVDVPGHQAGELEQVAALLGLDRQAVWQLADPTPRPQVESYGETFRVDVQAVCEQGGRLRGDELNIVVGSNFLLTVHPENVGFVEEFAEQQRGNGKVGQLTAEAFLTALLNWHLNSYLHEVEALEGRLDGLDEAILQRPSDQAFLSELVGHRRRAGELRRLLTDHRDVYATLSRPDFKALADPESARNFDALEERFERAVAAVEGLREAILGSFDLYMTSLGQRTNDTMRVLTVATVLMGMWALVAGVFGMNFELPFEKNGPHGFLVVVVALLLLTLAVFWLARRRRWL